MKNLKLILSVLVLTLGVLSFVSADCQNLGGGLFSCEIGQECPSDAIVCACPDPYGDIGSGSMCGLSCVEVMGMSGLYNCGSHQYCPSLNPEDNCSCNGTRVGNVCYPSLSFSQCTYSGVTRDPGLSMQLYKTTTGACEYVSITCDLDNWIGILNDKINSGYIYTGCNPSGGQTGSTSNTGDDTNTGSGNGNNTGGGSSGGGSYGGGGSVGSTTGTTQTGGNVASNNWLNLNDYTKFGDIKNSPYSQEVNLAYLYAYNIGSTTMPTVFRANLDGNLLRSHMAKMIVEWSKKVLGLKADKNIKCNFDDIDYLKKQDLYAYIIEACQMGLMGIDNYGKPKTSFDPAETVTRGQFGTVLSRAIWGDANNGGDPFYNYHLEALKSVGVMTKISEPQNTEVRKWVMLMLHRTHELLSK